MRATLARCLHDLGKRDALPIFDGVLVSLAGTPLGFLRRPAEPLPQEAAHMIVVERDAKVSLDQVGDALRGPKFVGPAMRFGALA